MIEARGEIFTVLLILVGVIVVPVGLLVGTLAGYVGGMVDNVLMRVVDVFFAIPFLFVILVAAQFLGHGDVFSIILIFGLLTWPLIARLVRAQFLSLREQDFVDAATAVWSSDLVIKVKEPLPAEYGLIKEGLLLFTFLHLAPLPDLVDVLIEKKVRSVAYETVEAPDGMAAWDTLEWYYLTLGALQAGYDPIRDTQSELGAVDAPYRWVMNVAGFMGLGLSLLAFAIAYRMVLPGGWVHWLAQDADGAWWGFEVEPLMHDSGWYENEVGRYIRAGGGIAFADGRTDCAQPHSQAASYIGG